MFEWNRKKASRKWQGLHHVFNSACPQFRRKKVRTLMFGQGLLNKWEQQLSASHTAIPKQVIPSLAQFLTTQCIAEGKVWLLALHFLVAAAAAIAVTRYIPSLAYKASRRPLMRTTKWDIRKNKTRLSGPSIWLVCPSLSTSPCGSLSVIAEQNCTVHQYQEASLRSGSLFPQFGAGSANKLTWEKQGVCGRCERE